MNLLGLPDLPVNPMVDSSGLWDQGGSLTREAGEIGDE